MTITAGPPDSAFGSSLQIGAMAQSACGRQVPGGFVAAGGGTAPGRIGMGRIPGVAVFTTVGQIAHRCIEPRIAAGAAVRRCCVAFLTIAQIGFGLRSVQIGIGKRHRMRCAGPAGMAAGRRSVGIGKAR